MRAGQLLGAAAAVAALASCGGGYAPSTHNGAPALSAHNSAPGPSNIPQAAALFSAPDSREISQIHLARDAEEFLDVFDVAGSRGLNDALPAGWTGEGVARYDGDAIVSYTKEPSTGENMTAEGDGVIFMDFSNGNMDLLAKNLDWVDGPFSVIRVGRPEGRPAGDWYTAEELEENPSTIYDSVRARHRGTVYDEEAGRHVPTEDFARLWDTEKRVNGVAPVIHVLTDNPEIISWELHEGGQSSSWMQGGAFQFEYDQSLLNAKVEGVPLASGGEVGVIVTANTNTDF